MKSAVRRIVRLVPLLVAVCLAAGLLCASGASTTSPSPASGQTVLKVGWDRPDSLNPFVGVQQSSYESSTSATTSSPTMATSTSRLVPASPRAGPRAPMASPGPSRSAAA